MKKRDEGYVLPLVLVVLVVICLITVSLLSVSLNNLKNQQAMIERMQDQYEAQGLVEKAVQHLKTNIIKAALNQGTELPVIDGVSFESEDISERGHISWKSVLVDGTPSNKLHTCTLIIKAVTNKGYEVNAEIIISVSSDDDSTIQSINSIEYTSYEVSKVEVTRNG